MNKDILELIGFYLWVSILIAAAALGISRLVIWCFKRGRKG